MVQSVGAYGMVTRGLWYSQLGAYGMVTSGLQYGH